MGGYSKFYCLSNKAFQRMQGKLLSMCENLREKKGVSKVGYYFVIGLE
jgi:hypothetical protein